MPSQWGQSGLPGPGVIAGWLTSRPGRSPFDNVAEFFRDLLSKLFLTISPIVSIRFTFLSPPFQNRQHVPPLANIVLHRLLNRLLNPARRISLFGVAQFVGNQRRKWPNVL